MGEALAERGDVPAGEMRGAPCEASSAWYRSTLQGKALGVSILFLVLGSTGFLSFTGPAFSVLPLPAAPDSRLGRRRTSTSWAFAD